MLKKTLTLVISLCFSLPLAAGLLPGFAAEPVTDVPGFLTSIAFDPQGRLYFSTTDGNIYRLEGSAPEKVATVPAAWKGNAALLGIAFDAKGRVIAHWTLPDLTAEMISRVDLGTGQQTDLAKILCNSGNPSSTEHHGGNPIVGPDGTIWVGFGDFGSGGHVQEPEHPSGKLYRIDPVTGEATIWALGFRNPYDLAWDAAHGQIVISDNGAVSDDEINLVHQGDNCGWPRTEGTQPPVPGMLPPAYTFPSVTAPTGMALTSRAGLIPAGGLLQTAFVTMTLYFFPSLEGPLSPVPLVVSDSPLLDVSQHASGEIYFGSGSQIWRLLTPIPGDANGDRLVNDDDFDALSHEILDEGASDVYHAQDGAFAASWGADVNGDGVIDARDLVALAKVLRPRQRAVTR